MKSEPIEDQVFLGKTFEGNALAQKDYEQCTFVNCIFQRADLSDIIFSDCQFTDCDLSMATLNETAFRDTTFTNCKLLGLRFDTCNPFSLSFKFVGCTLQFSSFFRLKIPKTTFQDCKLEEVEFVEADLNNAVFSHCDLSRAIFKNSNLEGADLRTAIHFSIDPEANRIQKAKFSRQNIAGLLDKYRILID